MDRTIHVYADWEGLQEPMPLGRIHVTTGRGGADLFAFAYEPAVIEQGAWADLHLDPRIGMFAGRQYPSDRDRTFGMCADASPDRWGRLLMDRRLERDRRAGRVPEHAQLHEADYLLGVHDTYRIGGLRLKVDVDGPFLDDQHDRAAPPLTRVRELEAASLALERDEENRAADGDDWLRLLIAPGGSLGGARPKASVCDTDGSLWIAKFPSHRDQHDQGAWELILLTLAQVSGLRVPRARLLRVGHHHRTFLVERFDRTPRGTRLHFASAMTLTGRVDGDDATTGASYLDLADVIMRQGVDVDADLRELWTRIVFNMLVSNTDDHLRNHGFLLIPHRGWALSPAYDMNPVPQGDGLKLNVNERDNALDLELAREVAPIFRMPDADAVATITRLRTVVRTWPRLAARLGIPASEQERMARAFHLA